MHSPLEIAKNFIEIGMHKVRLSAYKMLILGIFAGIFIGFAGIAATTTGTTSRMWVCSRWTSWAS